MHPIPFHQPASKDIVLNQDGTPESIFQQGDVIAYLQPYLDLLPLWVLVLVDFLQNILNPGKKFQPLLGCPYLRHQKIPD